MRSAYRFTSAVLAAGLFLALPPAAEGQQAGPSPQDTLAEIHGAVQTAARARPVENVQIELVDLDRSTVTDQAGEFRFTEVPPGEHRIVVRHLGRTSGEVGFEIAPGDVGRFTIDVYERVVEADELEVDVRREGARDGKLAGFYERKDERPVGTFISPEEIRDTGGTRLADVFRSHTFLDVRNCSGARGSDCFTLSDNRGSGVCNPTVYLDGALIGPGHSQSSLLESTPKEWIAAIEVYRGSQAPSQFSRGIGNCGVVLLWTQSGAIS